MSRDRFTLAARHLRYVVPLSVALVSITFLNLWVGGGGGGGMNQRIADDFWNLWRRQNNLVELY